MPIELIDKEAHAVLLQKINRLPFGDRHASVYRNTLTELFEQYNEQIIALFGTIKAYREVAELVHQQHPLSNRTKYVRVRRKTR